MAYLQYTHVFGDGILKFLPLRKNPQFKEVYNKGKSYATKNLVLYILENGEDYNYLGVSISKKVGKSNLRNLIKRRIKNCFNILSDKVEKGHNLVFIVRPRAKDSSYADIHRDMVYLFKKMKLWIG